MGASTPQMDQLKSALKATWMAGDFGEIAKYSVKAGEDFIPRVGIKPGQKVLDVACGTGNVSLPAARAGADVTGVDIAPNLIEQAKRRAVAEGLRVRFEEGDAEELPYPDAHFDAVVTMFGAMFAPRPDRVSEELARVCKPGGTIAMANWTPEGFVGKTFRTTAKHVPPPPGVSAPIQWGDEEKVRERLGDKVKDLTFRRHVAKFDYPFPPGHVLALFREYFGPTKMAYTRLDPQGQAALTAEMEDLWNAHNTAKDGTTSVDAEYLEVKAARL